MAGAKGRSGGARPGAGRKPEGVIIAQQSFRDVILATVTRADWQEITATAIKHAKQGDYRAREWIASWTVGKVPETLEISGPNGGPIPTSSFDFQSAVTAIARGPAEDS